MGGRFKMSKAFVVKEFEDYFIVTRVRDGKECKIYRWEAKCVCEITLRSFFLGYPMRSYGWDRNKFTPEYFDAPETFYSFIKRVIHIAKTYWDYRKRAFFSIWEDYSIKLSNFENKINLKEYEQYYTMFNELSNDLEIAKIEYKEGIDIFKGKFKPRKDVFRILKENKILVSSTVLKTYFKDEDYFNNFLLILEQNKLYDQLPKGWSNNNYDTYLDTEDSKFYTLIKEHGYDTKKVLLNFCNYFNIYENITWRDYIIYLTDYVRMNKVMGIKYEKFPKYLVSKHDITSREFELHRKEYDEQIFREQTDYDLEWRPELKLEGEGTVNDIDVSNVKIVYKRPDLYNIVAPTSTDDVRNEGKNLGHCVGSYIDRIIKGETKIMFMRQDVNESLLTVEIRGERIVQVRGEGNRDPTKIENEWLKIYARKKKLTCSYIY